MIISATQRGGWGTGFVGVVNQHRGGAGRGGVIISATQRGGVGLDATYLWGFSACLPIQGRTWCGLDCRGGGL